MADGGHPEQNLDLDDPGDEIGWGPVDEQYENIECDIRRGPLASYHTPDNNTRAILYRTYQGDFLRPAHMKLARPFYEIGGLQEFEKRDFNSEVSHAKFMSKHIVDPWAALNSLEEQDKFPLDADQRRLQQLEHPINDWTLNDCLRILGRANIFDIWRRQMMAAPDTYKLKKEVNRVKNSIILIDPESFLEDLGNTRKVEGIGYFKWTRCYPIIDLETVDLTSEDPDGSSFYLKNDKYDIEWKRKVFNKKNQQLPPKAIRKTTGDFSNLDVYFGPGYSNKEGVKQRAIVRLKGYYHALIKSDLQRKPYHLEGVCSKNDICNILQISKSNMADRPHPHTNTPNGGVCTAQKDENIQAIARNFRATFLRNTDDLRRGMTPQNPMMDAVNYGGDPPDDGGPPGGGPSNPGPSNAGGSSSSAVPATEEQAPQGVEANQQEEEEDETEEEEQQENDTKKRDKKNDEDDDDDNAGTGGAGQSQGSTSSSNGKSTESSYSSDETAATHGSSTSSSPGNNSSGSSDPDDGHCPQDNAGIPMNQEESPVAGPLSKSPNRTSSNTKSAVTSPQPGPSRNHPPSRIPVRTTVNVPVNQRAQRQTATNCLTKDQVEAAKPENVRARNLAAQRARNSKFLTPSQKAQQDKENLEKKKKFDKAFSDKVRKGNFGASKHEKKADSTRTECKGNKRGIYFSVFNVSKKSKVQGPTDAKMIKAASQGNIGGKTPIKRKRESTDSEGSSQG